MRNHRLTTVCSILLAVRSLISFAYRSTEQDGALFACREWRGACPTAFYFFYFFSPTTGLVKCAVLLSNVSKITLDCAPGSIAEGLIQSDAKATAILVLGEWGVGKSTLINDVIGRPVVKTGSSSDAVTTDVTEVVVRAKRRKGEAVFYDTPRDLKQRLMQTCSWRSGSPIESTKGLQVENKCPVHAIWLVRKSSDLRMRSKSTQLFPRLVRALGGRLRHTCHPGAHLDASLCEGGRTRTMEKEVARRRSRGVHIQRHSYLRQKSVSPLLM